MERILHDATKTPVYHKCGWTILTSNGLQGRTMVINNWPTFDMRALTAAALFMLKNNECDSVMLHHVLDLDSAEQLTELGWMRTSSGFILVA